MSKHLVAAVEAVATKYDLDGDGRITLPELRRASGAPDDAAAARALVADLAAPAGALAAADRHVEGQVAAARRLRLAPEAASLVLPEPLVRGFGRHGRLPLDAKRVADHRYVPFQRALQAHDPVHRLVALGLVDGAAGDGIVDASYMSRTKAGWRYRDAAGEAPALLGAERLERVQNLQPISPANVEVSTRTGRRFVSVQTAGRDGARPALRLHELGADGVARPYPDAAFAGGIGGIIGIELIPKPAAFRRGAADDGELLVGLDYEKNRFFAVDTATDRVVFDQEVPGGHLLHMLNDVAYEPASGTFVLSDPALVGKSRIGVYQPDWLRPERSRYHTALAGHRSTAAGDTRTFVRDEKIRTKLFDLFGLDVKVDSGFGVDSIAVLPDTDGAGPAEAMVLYSPIQPRGPAKLWAVPLRALLDAGDRAAVEAAATCLGRIPMTDGMAVFARGGRWYLTGADVQNGGLWLMDLATGEARSLVRDPARIGWADGVSVVPGDGGVWVYFADSNLDETLPGKHASPERQNVWRVWVEDAELAAVAP